MQKVDKCIRDSLIAASISERTWEYDISTGETTIVDSLLDFLGYSKSEIKNHMDFLFTLIHLEDIKDLANVFNEVITGKNDYFKVQYRIRLKNNGYIWVKSVGKALKDEQGRNVYMAGAHLDIKPYKQFEESEQKYETLFNNVNDIILLADIREDGTSGKFIKVNTVATETLGYSREEFSAMGFDDIYSRGIFKSLWKIL